MAHRILRIDGLDADISNPYDPANMDTEVPLGMKDAPGAVVGKKSVASLLPGEISSHYLTYDCHRRVKQCQLGGDDYECVSCRSLGGGTCVKASAELIREHRLTSDGVCIPLGDRRHLLEEAGEANPFTTVKEAYLQVVEDNHNTAGGGPSSIISGGGSGGIAYLTRKLGCVNSSIVRKDPKVLDKNPNLEPIIGCTDIVMCGGNGVGAPIHPVTHTPIINVDDIDFDISSMAATLSCYCESGFTSARDVVSGVPSCKPSEGGVSQKEEGLGCPVVFYSGDTKGCLCDDSTQIRLEEILEIGLADTTCDYDKSYIEAAQRLSGVLDRYENMTSYTTRDACLPKPGVDPRMAALGYSYASTKFSTVPEITAFNGGHLMTGGLLRESAMDKDGNWHSRIEDNEAGKIVKSESLGGVVPYAGTGSVAAHVWSGDTLNDHGLVGLGGGDVINAHPNASMRVVPLPHTSVPGFGVDSMDHAVGIVASKGRVYPRGVLARSGNETASTHVADDDSTDASYVLDPAEKGYVEYRDSPLSRLRNTQDSGVCATAYVIPSVHRVVKEKPDARDDTVVSKVIPLLQYRPLAKRAGHTPVEYVFRQSVVTAVRHGSLRGHVTAKLFSELPQVGGSHEMLKRALIDHYFPGMHGDGRNKKAVNSVSVRGAFHLPNNEELTDIGGIIVQPVTVKGEGYSSTFGRFSEKILSTNSPKIIDHYKVDLASHKHTVDEDEARFLFPRPPTAWRIASNEGTFFSGRGLNNGVEGTGMRAAELAAEQSNDREFGVLRKPDAFAGAVMTGDGVLMHGESAPTLRPMDIPAGTLPENTWFERRDPVNARGDAGDGSVLKRLNNAYAAITRDEIRARVNSTLPIEGFNTYNPAKPYYEHYEPPPKDSVNYWVKFFAPIIPLVEGDALGVVKSIIELECRESRTVGSLHKIVPLKFHVDDNWWQQGRVTAAGPRIIPPTMAFFESELRLRTIASEGFVRPEILPNRFRADWGLSPHTAGHYMQAIYSPPCVREETGQAYGYPCSAALPQYMTMLVPKPVGENSHSSHTKETVKAYIEEQMREIPKNVGQLTPAENQGRDGIVENIFDKMGSLSKREKCNCTSDVFCPENHSGGKSPIAPVAALPSRGNRHTSFTLMSTIPKNDVHLATAVLRAQIGDSGVLDAIGRIRGNGQTAKIKDVLESGWGLQTSAMVAPNRWSAFRRNIAYTPYSTRPSQHLARVLTSGVHENFPGKFDRSAVSMGKGGNADMVRNDVVMRDSDGSNPDCEEILNFVNRAAVPGERGARARRILDFFESALGTAPSTFNVGTFCPHAEGAKDIVAVYATPVLTTVSSAPATINEGRSKTDSPKPRFGRGLVMSSHSVAEGSNTTVSNTKRKAEEEVDLETDAEVFRVDKFGKALDDIKIRRRETPNEQPSVDMVALYEASKNVPRVMRRIHLMPINTTYHGGMESGQTAAEAMCTRGVEIWYRDFVKPAMAHPDARTSMEGIRLKAPEPFDDLSVRGYYSTNPDAVRKFAHHHHYGYEGLMSRGYHTRKRLIPIPEGELKDNFPFICQSDRGVFPPKRDGTMQPLALVDMGVLSETAVGKTIIVQE